MKAKTKKVAARQPRRARTPRELLLEARVRGAYRVLYARGPNSLEAGITLLGDLISDDERREIERGMDAARRVFFSGGAR